MSVYCSLCLCMPCGMEEVEGGREGDEGGKIEGRGKRGGAERREKEGESLVKGGGVVLKL